MTAERLAAIRQRNEAVKACAVEGTNKCSYRDHDSALICCIHNNPPLLTADIDALLAEVERLSVLGGYIACPHRLTEQVDHLPWGAIDGKNVTRCLLCRRLRDHHGEWWRQ